MVKQMKQKILLCLLLILIGFILGRTILKSNTQNICYFLEEGVYSNETIFEANILNLKQKVMEYQDNKIHVYVGITKDKEVANTIKEIYKKENINLNIIGKNIKDEELNINIEQYDLLIRKSTTKEEILKIEEVVLANYEEIMKNRE